MTDTTARGSAKGGKGGDAARLVRERGESPAVIVGPGRRRGRSGEGGQGSSWGAGEGLRFE